MQDIITLCCILYDILYYQNLMLQTLFLLYFLLFIAILFITNLPHFMPKTLMSGYYPVHTMPHILLMGSGTHQTLVIFLHLGLKMLLLFPHINRDLSH